MIGPSFNNPTFLSNIGLIITYQCQVRCNHCVVQAGPDRKESLNLNDASRWIKELAAFDQGKVKTIALSGGEPFVDINRLIDVSAICENHELGLTAVTNAFWADSKKVAKETLQKISALKTLAISADAYHQKAIPISRVNNVVEAAEHHGIPYYIGMFTESIEDPAYKSVLNKLKNFVSEEVIFTGITYPVGRALDKVDIEKYATNSQPSQLACSLSAAPIISPSGDVFACIGPITRLGNDHPLYLGSLKNDTLSNILSRAEQNVILHALRVWGPRIFVDLATENGLQNHLPSRYITGSICDVCYNLMSKPQIVTCMLEAAKNVDFIRRVACGRYYYFHESAMLDRRPD